MRSRLLPLVALLSLAACSAGKDSPGSPYDGGTGGPRCSSDQQCSSNSACIAGACTMRAGTVPGWAIEVRPLGNPAAAITERTSIPSSGDVDADLNVTVSITFVASTNPVPASATPVPTSANVVVSVPSAIPGRPELTFETGVVNDLSKPLMLPVPQGVLSRGAIVQLIPAPPADQQSPPLSFTIPPQTGNDIRLTIPDDNRWIHGTLHDAVDDVPMRPYVARAYQQGRLVSNIANIMGRSANNQLPAADGTFSLAVPAALASNPVTIELSPQGTSASDPWITHDPLTLTMSMQQGNTLDIGIIRLPAYQVPQPFQVAVRGGDIDQPPVLNALVRAVTDLTPQADGTARFLRDGITDGQGLASLSLIPGMIDAGRTYQIAVVPPAGAPFSSRCLPDAQVMGGMTTQLAPIVVPRRQRLSGTVSSAGGSPVAELTVTASRDPATAAVCATATGPTATSATTDTFGRFELWLDPGIYQLDYVPAAGSAVPRHTEFDVGVSGDVVRSVHLPAGVLIEGTVRAPDGQKLQYATVRIFEPRCVTAGCTPPPLLRAETLTDADGHYRVVAATPTGN